MVQMKQMNMFGEEETPAKKKRGRPKKNTETQEEDGRERAAPAKDIESIVHDLADSLWTRCGHLVMGRSSGPSSSVNCGACSGLMSSGKIADRFTYHIEKDDQATLCGERIVECFSIPMSSVTWCEESNCDACLKTLGSTPKKGRGRSGKNKTSGAPSKKQEETTKGGGGERRVELERSRKEQGGERGHVGTENTRGRFIKSTCMVCLNNGLWLKPPTGPCECNSCGAIGTTCPGCGMRGVWETKMGIKMQCVVCDPSSRKRALELTLEKG